MNQIINLKLHPINSSNKYLNFCRDKLKKESVLQLNNFLLPNALKNIQKEATLLHPKAYYCAQKHTILSELNTCFLCCFKDSDFFKKSKSDCE